MSDRLLAIEEGLRECSGFRKREHAVAADLLLEAHEIAVSAGQDPEAMLADLLQRTEADIALAVALRWVRVARLISPETRAEFPRLSWSHYDWASTRLGAEALTPAQVRERLVLADDHSLSCAGLIAWLKRGGPPTDERHPAEAALDELCAGLSLAAEAAVRERWGVVTAGFTLRRRLAR